MSSIYVCGDTHGTYDYKKINTKNFPEQKALTKEDVLVILGDSGIIWYELGMNKEQEWQIKDLTKRNFTTACVLGNHENYTVIEKLPIVNKWGNKVYKLNDSIFFLINGVYTINNKKILVVRGAESTDKAHRVPSVSWWEKELLSKAEENYILTEIDSVSGKVDYVFTHTCPNYLISYFILNPAKVDDPVAKFLAYVSSLVEFKEWHFGHLHTDYRLCTDKGAIYHCHYNSEPYKLT
jgi:predicted phosphodiesterase